MKSFNLHLRVEVRVLISVSQHFPNSLQDLNSTSKFTPQTILIKGSKTSLLIFKHPFEGINTRENLHLPFLKCLTPGTHLCSDSIGWYVNVSVFTPRLIRVRDAPRPNHPQLKRIIATPPSQANNTPSFWQLLLTHHAWTGIAFVLAVCMYIYACVYILLVCTLIRDMLFGDDVTYLNTSDAAPQWHENREDTYFSYASKFTFVNMFAEKHLQIFTYARICIITATIYLRR